MLQNTKNGKKSGLVTAMFCALLLCMGLLCGSAFAASDTPSTTANAPAVMDLADIVEETAPSVVEVFTETKQVGRWLQEYVTEGIISALDREVTIDGETMTLMQTSAAVTPGNSGGGLFNLNGELVGVVNAKSSGDDVEGLAFAIPANTVKQVAQELMEHGYVTGRPQLGISVVQVARPTQGWQLYFDKPGFYVAQTSENNGLQVGDRIVQIDGTPSTAPLM